jgi:5-hydroxyisourate hydrolase
MSSLSTHILDQGAGLPAVNVEVLLQQLTDDGWVQIGTARTDADGRITYFGNEKQLSTGIFQLDFDTGDYFEQKGTKSFYPYVSVIFQMDDANQHYHVPLLLNQYGYSTYRGS